MSLTETLLEVWVFTDNLFGSKPVVKRNRDLNQSNYYYVANVFLNGSVLNPPKSVGIMWENWFFMNPELFSQSSKHIKSIYF